MSDIGDVMEEKEKLAHLIKLWYYMGKTYFKVVESELEKIDDQNLRKIMLAGSCAGFMDTSVTFFQENIKELYPPKKTRKGGKRKEPYLKVWIRKNNRLQFKIEDFLKDYPQYTDSTYRKRLNKTIAKMIEKRELIQISKDTFRVI
jgi:hypothetical protein